MGKKILSILIALLLCFALIACDKTNNNSNGNGNGNGNGNNNNEEVEKTYDLGGIDFNIRCNVAERIDPRNSEFERMYRNEKMRNIEKVEKKYNIKVNYLNYPSNASWGVERDNWIIQQAQQGLTDSHVFEVTSNSVANLAVQGAILPLDDLIEKYGNKGLWAKKRSFGTILGQSYVYDDVYSQAEEGIYYNSELLATILGEDRKLEPTKLWAEGKWTWEAFANLAHEINRSLDHERSEAEGGPQYVMGGRTYDWLYPMVGTNGGRLVDSNFNSHVNSEEVIDTINYLNSLYQVPGMWIDDAVMSNPVQPEFRNGNVVFHAGESWYLIVSNWWGGLEFDLDFVPYPVGPNAQEDRSKYIQTKVKTEASFVISSAFSKDKIPVGYENMELHDELIFQIWNDLLYFPEIDETTGEADLEDIKMNFYATRLMPFYAHEESRLAHLDIYTLAEIDHLYSVYEGEASYRVKFEEAIRHGDARNKMESLHSELQNVLNDKILSKKG